MLFKSILAVLCADAVADTAQDCSAASCSGTPGVSSLLAVRNIRFKSNDLITEEDVHGRAHTHAAHAAQAFDAAQIAEGRHKAVKLIENAILSEAQSTAPTPTPDGYVAYHQNMTSQHNYTYNNENATKCRQCAAAELDLIAVLKIAQDNHTTAQAKALDLAAAAQKHTKATQDYNNAVAAYTTVTTGLCPITLTYKATSLQFASVVSLAEELEPKATWAVTCEAWMDANKTLMDNAQGLYDAAAAVAVAADAVVDTKRAVEQTACADYLPTAAPPAMGPYTLLFQSQGSDSMFQNLWSNWFAAGGAVTSGAGKRAAYDNVPLHMLNFTTDGSKYAEVQLFANYSGQTLVNIVSSCMGSARSNNGQGLWVTGHCKIGDVINSNGISNIGAYLRIGVGDGQSDSHDWAVFFVETGNGAYDFHGTSVFAYGSEYQANTGHETQVEIWGK